MSSEQSRARYRAGLCVSCGEKPYSAGRPRCDECHHKRRIASNARRGMFRTSDRIDACKERRDDTLLADARTSMCDYRIALATALGRRCDRNGYTNV